MEFGRGTLGHGHRIGKQGHWERYTRTWTLGEGHYVMDTGKGTLGHG